MAPITRSGFPRIPLAAARLVKVAVLAIVYYFFARWSLLLAFEGTNASPVWPPSGIALGAILLLGRGVWPAIAIGAFAANLMAFTTHHPLAAPTLGASTAIAIGNTLEALVGLTLLRYLKIIENPLEQPQHVFRFLMAVLLMCMVGAGIGTTTQVLGGFAPEAAAWSVWINWWLGDIGGILIVTPLALAWLGKTLDRPPLPLAKQLQLAVMLTVFASMSAIILSGEFSADRFDRVLLFACIPYMAWVAFQYGQRGVTLAALLLAGIAIGYTTHGVGPFATGNLNNSLILLVSFIVLSSTTGLILASEISQRTHFRGAVPSFADIRLPWFTLLAAIGITMVAWHMISSSTEREARSRLDAMAREIESDLHKHMSDYEQVLRAGSAIFAASQEVSRAEWRNYVDQLEIRKRFPGMQLFAFNPWIKPAEKEAYIQHIRAEGFLDYSIRPAGDREAYSPITYIEPFDDRNLRAFGFDTYSEPVRRAALVSARDTGRTTISGKVRLVQEDSDSDAPGFVMFVPVYRLNMPLGTTEERRASLQGYVSSAFRMDVLIQETVDSAQTMLGIEIYDGSTVSAASRMYRSRALESKDSQRLYRHNHIDIPLTAGDRTWTLRVAALPAFEASIDRQKAQIILVAGFVVSLLLFILVRSLAMTRENALGLAAEMTAALRASETKLRLLNSRLELATEAGGIGVWDWDILADILSWDKRMYEIYGIDPNAAGNSYDMWRQGVHPNDLERVETALFDALAGGPEFSTEFDIILPGGEIRKVKADAIVVRDEAGKPRHMIGTNLDITELRQTEESLRASEARFRSIFEHAPIGMGIISIEGRWLSVNNAICDILGYDKQELEQNASLQDVTFPADLAKELALIEQLKAGLISSYQLEKRYVHKDGKIVWALLTVTLLRDETGTPLYFIKQIMNITERIQSAARLQATLAEKDVLLKEVYHRVKNNLQVISSLFNLQLRLLPEGQARTALKESADRVRAMALVHEKLYQSNDLSSIALDGYIQDLCRQLAAASGLAERGISLATELEPVEIGLELAVPLGLLLNELVSNSIKHGFPDGRSGNILIRLTHLHEDARTVSLEIRDDGVGLPPDMDFYTRTSLGLKLVGTLSAQINARFLLDSHDGTVARLVFSIDEPLRPDKMDKPTMERG